MIRVRCYIDGLNFYYGICRKYDIRWIDLEKLFQTLLYRLAGEDVVIEKLFLFTSTVSGLDGERQKIYFSALREHSGNRIKIIQGFFRENQIRGPVVVECDDGTITLQKPKVTILKKEEKRTDVNIACKMVDDAHIWDKEKIQSGQHRYDITCLISNDSDLASALRVKRILKQRVLLIPPIPAVFTSDHVLRPEWGVSGSLKRYTRRKFIVPYIKREDVEACLLPPKVGEFSAPNAKGWRI